MLKFDGFIIRDDDPVDRSRLHNLRLALTRQGHAMITQERLLALRMASEQELQLIAKTHEFVISTTVCSSELRNYICKGTTLEYETWMFAQLVYEHLGINVDIIRRPVESIVPSRCSASRPLH